MSDLKEMGLIDHLIDLRKMIVRSLGAIVLGFFACVYFSEPLFDFIRKPILPYLGQGGLVFTAPMDKFMAYLKVSFLAGTLLTCPYWLYQLWNFIAPGLYKHEKRYAATFIFFGSLLFIAGAAFVYLLVFPMAFEYLLTFGGTTDKPMITITEYMSFFMMITLVFGLVFEMPLVLVLLGMLGVVSHDFLKRNRRYAVVLLAVLSAVVTPPDAISMLALLGPLVLLYELSVWIVYFVEKKKTATA